MKVLFLTHTRLGDAVLSTGVVNHYMQNFPQARLTVVCSPLVESLFAAMPNVERVIAVRKRSYSRHWWDVWRAVAGARWDEVVDLRNSAVSRLIRAGKRHIWSPQPDTLHKVVQIANVIGVTPPPAPRLWFDEQTQNRVHAFIQGIGAPRIVIAPVANWPGKTWPTESYIELIARLDADGMAEAARLNFIIMAGPGEEAVAEKVLAARLPERGFSAIARFSPLETACVISQCEAFIGNDSGLMHCAAATGVPTLGLFGQSNRDVYAPWGDNARMVETPESFRDFLARPDYSPYLQTSLMGSLSVDTVHDAFRAMMKKGLAA